MGKTKKNGCPSASKVVGCVVGGALGLLVGGVAGLIAGGPVGMAVGAIGGAAAGAAAFAGINAAYERGITVANRINERERKQGQQRFGQQEATISRQNQQISTLTNQLTATKAYTDKKVAETKEEIKTDIKNAIETSTKQMLKQLQPAHQLPEVDANKTVEQLDEVKNQIRNPRIIPRKPPIDMEETVLGNSTQFAM